MKKFLSLLLILIFSFSVYGSLSFGNESTDLADCGSAAALDNLTTGTVLGWIYISAVSGNGYCGVLAGKGSAAFTGNKAYDTCPAAGVFYTRLIHQRNTTDLDAKSSNWMSTGNWYFIGYSFNSGGVDADQHLYKGTLTTTIAEETAYAKQVVGSGTVKDDSANSFDIGNVGTGTIFEGGGARQIAFVGIWNRQLSLAEIQAQQFHPHLTGNGDLGMWFPGANGTGTQTDFSGNLNNCTVTGATQSDNVPIGPVFGYVYTGPLPWSSIYARAL